jgi:hypothetical protein
MRRALIVWGFVIGIIGIPVCATATPVAVGSTYDAIIFDNIGNELFHKFTFDGIPETVLLGNGTHITATESEQATGPNAWAIDFLFTADGPIFSPSSTFEALNIGGFTDPVNLEFPLDPTAAILTFRNGGGNVLVTGNFGAPASPWDGFWPRSGFGGAWVGNFNTTESIELTIDATTPVPEPATLTLSAMGLADLLNRYRRRRSR